MTSIISLAAVHKKMRRKNKKMAIYSFFRDSALNMTVAQIDEISEIINQENKNVQSFLSEMKKKIENKKA